MKTAKEIYMYILGAVVVLAIIAFAALLIFVKIPQENKDTITTIAGCLITLAVTVVTFFFGSSKSSSDKNELLANSTPIIPTNNKKDATG